LRTHIFGWLVVLALLLISSGALLHWIYQSQGLSASFLVGLLLNIFWLSLLIRLFLRQQRLPIQMFRALANGDHTLGLPSGHALRQAFDAARTSLQQAHFNAAEQAQFLRQVLLQTDLALIIYRRNGEVIEQSSAAARLLGQRFDTLTLADAGLSRILLAENPRRHQTVPFFRGEQTDTLAVLIDSLQLAGELVFIATLQSIHEPLNAREQEAYLKLTRVLTHEIANSITPMASIAQSCMHLLPETLAFASAEDKADLKVALQTLDRRTKHLVEFISNFRQVSAVPKPMLRNQSLAEVVAQVYKLWQSQCQTLGIDLQLQLRDNRAVPHDDAQIGQVLINLVKNAVEALQQQRQQPLVAETTANTAPESNRAASIQLTLAPLSDHQTMIEVRDNGPGITAEAAAMIFVPFFTTKPAGSGIGLALARQIMRQHGGDVVYLHTGAGACFRLIFG